MTTLFSLLLILLSFLSLSLASPGLIGINYGRIANDLQNPTNVVQLLKTQNLTRVKLYDSDSSVLSALSGSGISVTIALPNEHLSAAAADQSYTDTWVQSNVAAYAPGTKIECVAVGNEVFVDPANTTNFLVPAMKNMYASLQKYNLEKTIKISSPIALSALQTSYPSSSGSFKSELIEPAVKPMLEFLKQTGSYLMVNAYPFFAYSANTDTISLDYALFTDKKGVVDSGNGLQYFSLLDAQLDAVYAAMKALQYNDIKIVVSETGWPSKGDEAEKGAGQENAQGYNGNLIKRVLTGNGTPLKPDEPLDVYLFALFNENQKTGPTSERNYGLFYPNGEKVYDVAFNGLESTPVNTSRNQVPVVGNGDVATTAKGDTWCVANGEAGEEKLQKALDYACGEGGADCRPIQEGATCYDPNTLEAHASYAFNSYYQKKTRGVGTCDFGGAAYVVTQYPKYGSCAFPTRY